MHTLELNNKVNGQQMLGARFLTVGIEVPDKQKERARIVHVVMNQNWRHQYTLSLIYFLVL